MCIFVFLLPIEGFFLKANFVRTISPPVDQRAVLIWQNVISDVLVRVKTVHNDWKSVQCPIALQLCVLAVTAEGFYLC